jgi:hypothetical protein
MKFWDTVILSLDCRFPCKRTLFTSCITYLTLIYTFYKSVDYADEICFQTYCSSNRVGDKSPHIKRSTFFVTIDSEHTKLCQTLRKMIIFVNQYLVWLAFDTCLRNRCICLFFYDYISIVFRSVTWNGVASTAEASARFALNRVDSPPCHRHHLIKSHPISRYLESHRVLITFLSSYRDHLLPTQPRSRYRCAGAISPPTIFTSVLSAAMCVYLESASLPCKTPGLVPWDNYLISPRRIYTNYILITPICSTIPFRFDFFQKFLSKKRNNDRVNVRNKTKRW